MRIVVSILCALFMALPAGAQEKKSGPRLTERGIPSYVLLPTAAEGIRVRLRGANHIVGTVTIDPQSVEDHIITVDPAIGEPFVIEAFMSRMELTVHTAHERVIATFDAREGKWNLSGSDSLYRRVLPEVEIAGMLLLELQERGVLPSPAIPSSGFQQDPGTDSGDGNNGPCTGISNECSGGAFGEIGACSKARASCNQTCWNRYCVGCCKFTTCLYACIGPWCAASITGTACSSTDRP
jgi:hypothetical protein